MPNNKGASGFENLIVISIVGLLVGVAIGRFSFVLNYARETALKAELINYRSSLNLYKAVERKLPATLDELENREMEIELSEGKKIKIKPLDKKLKKDEKGRVIDPFGNPYVYDSKGGKIMSATKGYEKY